MNDYPTHPEEIRRHKQDRRNAARYAARREVSVTYYAQWQGEEGMARVDGLTVHFWRPGYEITTTINHPHLVLCGRCDLADAQQQTDTQPEPATLTHWRILPGIVACPAKGEAETPERNGVTCAYCLHIMQLADARILSMTPA